LGRGTGPAGPPAIGRTTSMLIVNVLEKCYPISARK
jgi:hypothetical protein